jgi:hypothetical protein
VSWAGIFLICAGILGLPPAFLAAARRHDPAGVVAVLVIAVLGAAVSFAAWWIAARA